MAEDVVAANGDDCVAGVCSIASKFRLSQRGSDGDLAGLVAGLRETVSYKDEILADAMELADSGNWSLG